MVTRRASEDAAYRSIGLPLLICPRVGGPSSRNGSIVAAFFGFLLLAPSLFGESNDSLTFERDVRPIFKAQCFHCHGEDDELHGGLDLRLVLSLIHI